MTLCEELFNIWWSLKKPIKVILYTKCYGEAPCKHMLKATFGSLKKNIYEAAEIAEAYETLDDKCEWILSPVINDEHDEIRFLGHLGIVNQSLCQKIYEFVAGLIC